MQNEVGGGARDLELERRRGGGTRKLKDLFRDCLGVA